MRVVALLRGVNVGGVRFAMRDLAAALEQRGCTDVRTVLASGNVVVTTDAIDATAVARDVADVIRDRFGFDVGVIAAEGAVVAAAAAAFPFPRSADRHAYVVFADRATALTELVAAAGQIDPAVEQVAAGDGVLHWSVFKLSTLT